MTRKMNKKTKTVKRPTNQKGKILSYLSKGKEITVNEAWSRFGVQRLSARIEELRKEGYRIYTNKKKQKYGVDKGDVVTSYRLAE